MGQLNFGKLGEFGSNETEIVFYHNELDPELLNFRIKKITKAISHIDDYVCYLVGLGGLPKDTYLKLIEINGVDVIWFNSILPKFVRFLSVIVASYAGVVKVSDINIVSEVFPELIDQSMAGTETRVREQFFLILATIVL